MKIVIIGCGYVGSALARHWMAQRHTVTVTTRSPERVPALQSLAHRVVVVEKGQFQTALAEQERVLICVAPDGMGDYASTYLQTVRRVINQLDSTTQQVLYTGSTSVYGDHAGKVVDESTPPSPLNSNSKILLETEECLLAASSVKSCVMRLGEIIGPGRFLSERLRRMQGSSAAGSGNGATNLSALTDIVGGLDFALNRDLAGVYNLCNDLHMSRKELYEHICAAHGIPPVQWDKSLPNPHAGNKVVSSAKLQSAGFHFTAPAAYFYQ